MNTPTSPEGNSSTMTELISRAYATFDIKSLVEDARIIEGMASTPTPDRMGDIVDPDGAKYQLPLPLLWQHDSHEPIGHVVSVQSGKGGMRFRATIAKIAEPGALRDRIDNAWQTLKAGLVRGVSIGFRSLEHSFIKDDDGRRRGVHFKSWEWLELSAVTVPANSEATIQTIKSLDHAQRAASGKRLSGVVYLNPPGASGQQIVAKEARK